MRAPLLALLMLSLLAPPAFAHGSHDDDLPPASEEQKEEQKMDTAPSAPTRKPAAQPAEGGEEPAADSQAVPKPTAPNKEP